MLIAASLCLAAMFGVKSGSQAHQTQELQVCQTAVTVKVNQDQVAMLQLQTGTFRCCAVQKDQLEALSSLHADAVKKYRLHEESRVIMEVCSAHHTHLCIRHLTALSLQNIPVQARQWLYLLVLMSSLGSC